MYNNPRAKAGKELSVKVIPEGKPIADATTPQKVGKGNLCRVKGVADAFISFGDDEAALTSKTLDASATDTMQMEAGYFIVAATGDYVKTSAAMRIEIIKD